MRRQVVPLAARSAFARRLLALEPWCNASAPRPRPGQVALLTVTNDDAFLFELAPGLPHAERVPLGARAQTCLQRTGALALLCLPVRRSEDPDFGVRFIASASDAGAPESVDGESLSLSFFLAWLSWHLARPVPSGVVASANVQLDGAIVAVQSIEEKAALVAALMPAGTRLLVSTHQTRQDSCGVPTEHVSRLQNLLELFGKPQDLVEGRPVAEIAANLFELAMGPTPPQLNWSVLADVAAAASQRGGATEEERSRLAAAEAVARRHAGGTDQQLGPVAGLSGRIMELRLLAHRVQQANDTGSESLAAVVQAASRELPAPAASLQEELRVHGAIGRALTSLRRHDEARALLEATVQAWRGALQPEEASHPLSAWLHLLAFSGSLDEARRAEATARQLMGDGMGAMFPSLYLGRMWFRRGDRSAARSWFERATSFVLPQGPRCVVARFASLDRGQLVDEALLAERPHILALTQLELAGSSDDAAYRRAFSLVPEAAHLIRASGGGELHRVLTLEYVY